MKLFWQTKQFRFETLNGLIHRLLTYQLTSQVKQLTQFSLIEIILEKLHLPLMQHL